MPKNHRIFMLFFLLFLSPFSAVSATKKHKPTADEVLADQQARVKAEEDAAKARRELFQSRKVEFTKILEAFHTDTGAVIYNEDTETSNLAGYTDVKLELVRALFQQITDKIKAQALSLKETSFSIERHTEIRKNHMELGIYTPNFDPTELSDQVVDHLAKRQAAQNELQALKKSAVVGSFSFDQFDVDDEKSRENVPKLKDFFAQLKDWGIEVANLKVAIVKSDHYRGYSDETTIRLDSEDGSVSSILLNISDVEGALQMVKETLAAVAEAKTLAEEIVSAHLVKSCKIGWDNSMGQNYVNTLKAFKKVAAAKPGLFRDYNLCVNDEYSLYRVMLSIDGELTLGGRGSLSEAEIGQNAAVLIDKTNALKKIADQISAKSKKHNLHFWLESLDDQEQSKVFYEREVAFLQYLNDHYADLGADLSDWTINTNSGNLSGEKLLSIDTSAKRITVVMEEDFVPERAFNLLRDKLAQLH